MYLIDSLTKPDTQTPFNFCVAENINYFLSASSAYSY